MFVRSIKWPGKKKELESFFIARQRNLRRQIRFFFSLDSSIQVNFAYLGRLLVYKGFKKKTRYVQISSYLLRVFLDIKLDQNHQNSKALVLENVTFITPIHKGSHNV